MFKTIIVLVLSVLLLVSNNIVFSQDTTTQSTRLPKHPLTDMPISADDIDVAFYYPKHSDLKFPIGENVDILCHFSNDGASFYNISAIMGSLNSPFNFQHHFQNYSYKPFGLVVKPGEETTLKYSIQFHPELEPVEYQLAVTIFYESETEGFSSTFFNQTIEMYYPTNEYDLETISAVLGGFLMMVFVGAVTLFACFPDQKIPILSNFGKQFPVQPSSFSDNDDDDWIPVESKKAKRAKRD